VSDKVISFIRLPISHFYLSDDELHTVNSAYGSRRFTTHRIF